MPRKQTTSVRLRELVSPNKLNYSTDFFLCVSVCQTFIWFSNCNLQVVTFNSVSPEQGARHRRMCWQYNVENTAVKLLSSSESNTNNRLIKQEGQLQGQKQ